MDEESGVFEVDPSAEAPDLNHEDALAFVEAHASLQRPPKAGVRDGPPLVGEVPVAPQHEPGRTKRRWPPQRVPGSARSVASLATRTLPQKS